MAVNSTKTTANIRPPFRLRIFCSCISNAFRRMQRRLPARSHALFRIPVFIFCIGVFSTFPLHAQSSAPSTGTVTIHVEGLTSNEGKVRAALTTAQNYDDDGNVRAAELAIQDKKARWTLEDVPVGTYAVRLYHDEDDDDEIDTNLVGVPQEAFGFSKNARGTMGPPDFEEAAFTVEEDSLSMTITTE